MGRLCSHSGTRDHYSGRGWLTKEAGQCPGDVSNYAVLGREMSLATDSSISQRQQSLIVTTPISSDVRSVQLYLANYVVEV